MYNLLPKMMLRTLQVIVFSGISSTLLAQGIEGSITDQKGRPISVVNVYIGDGLQHTHTNELGFFELKEVSIGDTLSISSLGFSIKKLVIGKEHFDGRFTIKMDEALYDLSQVVISDAGSTSRQLSKLDLKTNPVGSSQEILQQVPGLIIGQHAGGGKAEQLFLRGFDLDHGTDIEISVDGMPVNMVSHAHGQGYADLHFLIPEVVERITYSKGPYESSNGNFSTAGSVAFQTRDRLEESSINLEYGRYNTLRMLGLIDLSSQEGPVSGYLAIENLQTDGPFDASQDFNRLNLMSKLNYDLGNGDQLSLSASRFNSSWNASGQIPQRAIESGLITRFGAIDDTEGGTTSRTNFAVSHTKSLGQRSFLKSNAYLVNYDFELFSNFTFFLNDPENGDQIKQKESRNIAGLSTRLFKETYLGKRAVSLQAGAGFRSDDMSDSELSHTADRSTLLDAIYLGDIQETNLYAFTDVSVDFGKLSITPGVRMDHFKFDYHDKLSANYSYRSVDQGHISPKLQMTYHPSRNWHHFFKIGKGFHSNDTRGIVSQSLGNDSGKFKTVPAAYGADLGSTWAPVSRLLLTGTLWYLFSDQEFVYVGDEGVVEASGRSQRIGVDFGIRAQLSDHLFLYGDYNFAHARSIDEPEGEDRIPLAPVHTATGGVNYRMARGLNAGLKMVFVSDRPALEDYSLVAKGYFRTDANVQYEFEHFSVGVVVQNLFNTDWNETQFATESQLAGETASVEEIHFTPGIPFAPRLKVGYRF